MANPSDELRESWRANSLLSARLAEVSSACVAAERKVGGLEERLTAVRTDRDRLAAETLTLRTKVGTLAKLDERMSALEQENNKLKISVENTKSEKFSIIQELAREKDKCVNLSEQVVELNSRLRQQEAEILELKTQKKTASMLANRCNCSKTLTEPNQWRTEVSTTNLDNNIDTELVEKNSQLLKELERVVADRELLRKKLASVIKQSHAKSNNQQPYTYNEHNNEILTERRARESLQREVFSLREKLSKANASKDALSQRVLQLEHAQLRAMTRPQSRIIPAGTSPQSSVEAKMPGEVAAMLAVEPLVLKL